MRKIRRFHWAGVLGAAVISLAAVARPRSAGAQVATAGTMVSGIVYDSVSRAPLANAEVELAEAGATRAIARRTRSDSAGRFEMSNVRAGRYLIGFYHPLLDSLSVELPTKIVDVATEPVRMVLAIPSLSTIAAALCPNSSNVDSTGTLIGRVYDAVTLGGLTGATVSVWWREMVVTKEGGLQQREPRFVAPTGDDGGFAFCAVPAKTEFGLSAIRGDDSTDMVALTVPPGGVTRRDLFVGHWSATDSAARRIAVRGRVHTSDGHPIANASVALRRSGQIARTDTSGRFETLVAAGGTHRLDVRHIGYAATTQVVDLVVGRPVSVDVMMVSMKHVMDTVRVIASRVYDADSFGFQKRRRTGMGHYFGPEDVEKLHVLHVSDLFYRVPQVRIRGTGLDRIVVMRNFFFNGECEPTVYVDGVRLSEMGVDDIDSWVSPEDLAGLEVYNSPERAPMEFTTLDGCGSLVLWTRRGVRPKRQ